MKTDSSELKGMSELEKTFYLMLKAEKIEGFIFNYKFHPTRKWKIDFANPDPSVKIAVEIEGGIWMKKARHTSGLGMLADAEKYNEVTKAGLRLLRYCNIEQMRRFKEDYKLLTNDIS
jgi:very-short-patch-repair endonuclease